MAAVRRGWKPVVVAALSLTALAAAAAPPNTATSHSPTGQSLGQAEIVRLTGVVRDFRRSGEKGGHPDFQEFNTGHRVGLVQHRLDADGKPVLACTHGQNVNTQFRDREGRNIMPWLVEQSRGDRAGVLTPANTPAVSSEETFRQWFRDVPSVNLSKTHTVTLVREPGSSMYVFAAEDDPSTPEREGFFPTDHMLFNDTDPQHGHNYHFTFELSTRFTYRRGSGQVFTFTGDDDAWLFIDGKLALDVGGVHRPVSQTIELDRFADAHGLLDGMEYSLRFFLAERRTPQSNCRIETTIALRNTRLPATTALYD